MRCREVERDPLVDDLALLIAKGAQRGAARRRQAANHARRDCAGARPGNARDAYPTPPGRRRYRDDRVARYVTAWHGQACRDRTCAESAIAEGWRGCC